MRQFLIILGAACSLLSCTKSESTTPVKASGTKFFYAEVPSEETKTYIDSGYEIYWTADDRISVFCSTANEQYRFTGETGTRKGTFENLSAPSSPTFDRNYAVYPYQVGNASSIEGTIAVTLPSVQSYAENSFGLGANTMVAVTEDLADDKFKFRNCCGYLMLKLYGGDKIKSITLRGNGGEKIAGAASITAEYGESPSIVMDAAATTEITLNCPAEGVPTNESAEQYTQFWVVIPPMTFANGFTIDIANTADDVISQSTAKSVTISRNKILKMAPVKVDTQNAHEFLSFSLSDGISTYEAFDISDGYVNVQVPNGTDMSNMTASFTFNGASVKVNDVPQTSGVGTHDFSDFVNPVSYVVTSKAGTSQSYVIRMFNLPIVFATTPNGTPITSKDIWTSECSFKIRDTDGTLIDYGSSTMRGRGNSTWAHPKKPYTVKFEKKKEVLGMPADKRWNLLANWRDRTLVRNAAGLEIARRTESLDWTPSGQFVELFLNGKYLGNYFLCEHIKVAPNRVNIVEINASDTSPEKISGGYLLEYDTYFDEVNKFRPERSNYPVNLKSPDELGFDAQVSYINSFINELERRLYTPEEMNTRTYLEMLDPDSFVDWWFVYEIVGNGYEPSGPRSCYFHKDRGEKIKAGPVWDFDSYTFRPGVYGFRVNNALYYERLFADPYFVSLVKKKWPVLKERLAGMDNYIESQQNYILNSSLRDAQMWPIPTTFVRNHDEQLSVPEANLRLINNYSSRINELDNLIHSLVVNYDTLPGGNEDVGAQQDKADDFNFNFQ